MKRNIIIGLIASILLMGIVFSAPLLFPSTDKELNINNRTITDSLTRKGIENIKITQLNKTDDNYYYFKISGDINKKIKIKRTYENCSKYEWTNNPYNKNLRGNLSNNYRNVCMEYETITKTDEQALEERDNLIQKELERQANVDIERQLKAQPTEEIKFGEGNITISSAGVRL